MGCVLVCVRGMTRLLPLSVAVAALAGGGLARASVLTPTPTRHAPPSQVVLASPFRPMPAVSGLRASGDYLLLGTTISGNFTSTGWTVINERLGTRTALDPQCDVGGLGPPWVLMGCPSTSNPSGPFDDDELYSLTDGTRHTVTPNPGVPDPHCSSPPPDQMSPCSNADAVGAYWIRWDATCSVHCANTYFFQNIQTGELRDDPTNATTFVDLDSPDLARRTCPGVRLIGNVVPYGGLGWGSITPEGRYAIVTGRENNVFLERCGTRMREPIADTGYGGVLASSTQAIVWQTTTHLTGLFLPTLQKFTMRLPPGILKPTGSGEDFPVHALVLTSSALYVADGYYGRFWRTASPAALPRNTSRPSVTRSGSTLTCRRGSWRNAEGFSYTWRVKGVAHHGVNLTLAGERRSVRCSVTASNAAGATTASSG